MALTFLPSQDSQLIEWAGDILLRCAIKSPSQSASLDYARQAASTYKKALGAGHQEDVDAKLKAAERIEACIINALEEAGTDAAKVQLALAFRKSRFGTETASQIRQGRQPSGTRLSDAVLLDVDVQVDIDALIRGYFQLQKNVEGIRNYLPAFRNSRLTREQHENAMQLMRDTCTLAGLVADAYQELCTHEPTAAAKVNESIRTTPEDIYFLQRQLSAILSGRA